MTAAARAALAYTGWAAASLGIAGLVFTAAALCRSRRDDSTDDTGYRWLLQEVAGP